MHVYEDHYPLAPTATFKPPHATAAAYRQVQRALGLTRVVVIQPTGYAFDNRCTLAAMQALGPEARGIAVVPPEVGNDELSRLHDLGVRGVRYMMLPGGVLPWASLEAMAARIARWGWHIDLQIDGGSMPMHEAMLLRLPCRLVIDHVGKFLRPTTPDSEAFLSLRRVLDKGDAWIKLSAAYETSQSGAPDYEDVAVLGRALAAHYPERCLWASNWPHPNASPEPSNAGVFDWARRCVGNEAHWKRILVDNPAEVYGF
jgi:D-galactarolactone isomerase